MCFFLHSNPDTCWVTTGLFPQEVVVTLPSTITVSSVLIRSCNGRSKSVLDKPGYEVGN